jgi:hypothetical protein
MTPYTLRLPSINDIVGESVELPAYGLGIVIETMRPDGWPAQFTINVEPDGAISVRAQGAGVMIELRHLVGNGITIALAPPPSDAALRPAEEG